LGFFRISERATDQTTNDHHSSFIVPLLAWHRSRQVNHF
jgi:hypothetical protein